MYLLVAIEARMADSLPRLRHNKLHIVKAASNAFGKLFEFIEITKNGNKQLRQLAYLSWYGWMHATYFSFFHLIFFFFWSTECRLDFACFEFMLKISISFEK